MDTAGHFGDKQDQLVCRKAVSNGGRIEGMDHTQCMNKQSGAQGDGGERTRRRGMPDA